MLGPSLDALLCAMAGEGGLKAVVPADPLSSGAMRLWAAYGSEKAAHAGKPISA